MPLLRLAVCAGFLLLSLPGSAQESATFPESVGFEAPADLGALLAYRLSDWGWRTVEVAGAFEGGGNVAPLVENDEFYGRFDRYASLDLAAGLRWTHEGELSRRSLRVDGTGRWRRTRSQWSDCVTWGLEGRFEVDGRWDRYLARDRWFVSARLALASSHEEIHGCFIGYDESTGGYGHRVELGGGWGRLRDVEPLLRAQRLAERLVALGRVRPGRAQVLAAAEVLATRGGYGAIYDRPDRRFWQEVFAALTGGETLDLAEVLYLEDALAENLGDRRQGVRVEAGGWWIQNGTGDQEDHWLGTWTRATAARNLSLDHQLTASATFTSATTTRWTRRGSMRRCATSGCWPTASSSTPWPATATNTPATAASATT
ncbi:MAG: hypothetical protein R3D98_10375 [Candidatus Krumholzibacteriia bacterium]